MSDALHVAMLQMRCTDTPSVNLQIAQDMIRESANAGAHIVCLPELFMAPYFCQTEDHVHFDLAESIPGPTTEALQETARETGTVVIASLFERRAAGLYHNTTAVIDADGRYLGKYRKMHIPDDPLYYEKFYFTPGDLGFKTFETKFARIGVLICWDQWFPEAARLTAMQGAEILFYPTAIGWHPSEKTEFGEAQHGSWELIQRSHAVANGCYVFAVNRTGFEATPTSDSPTLTSAAESGGIEFWGQSFAADPSGTIIAKASNDKAEVVVVPVDRDRIDVTRTHWPFLRDRRIDAYGPLTKRYIDAD